MRVLIVSGSCPPIHCGISAYTQQLLDQLTRLEIDVMVLTHATAHATDRIRNSIERWSLHSMPRIEKIVRAFAPDVIHVQYPSVTFSHWPFVNLLPHLLRRRFRGVPVVVTLHEYHDATFPGRLRLWFTALGSDATIVSNEEDQQRLAHRGLKRLCTFPLGNLIPVQAPSAARAAAVRQQYNIQSKDLVGFVGMIDRDKRIEILLEATARLPTRPAILLLAGFAPSAGGVALQIVALVRAFPLLRPRRPGRTSSCRRRWWQPDY
jgi:glycosyltransferase involved in cell wall biosynthesis